MNHGAAAWEMFHFVTGQELSRWKRISYLRILDENAGSPFSRGLCANWRDVFNQTNNPRLLKNGTPDIRRCPTSEEGDDIREERFHEWWVGPQDIPRAVSCATCGNGECRCLDDWCDLGSVCGSTV